MRASERAKGRDGSLRGGEYGPHGWARSFFFFFFFFETIICIFMAWRNCTWLCSILSLSHPSQSTTIHPIPSHSSQTFTSSFFLSVSAPPHLLPSRLRFFFSKFFFFSRIVASLFISNHSSLTLP